MVMTFLDITAAVALVLVISSVIILLFIWPVRIKAGGQKFSRTLPVVWISTMAASVAIAFAACSISQHLAHDEVIHTLSSVTDSCELFINGQSIAKPGALLSSLRGLSWLDPHHSNPTKRFALRVTCDSAELVLCVARDSSDPREYWVFYPKYKITATNEIGRIRTTELDAY